MTDPGSDALPADVSPQPPVAQTPPAKARSGVIGLIVVICVAAAGAGAWYVWNRPTSDGVVGQCFPAATDGPLDSAHGTVSCSHPNAQWEITKVIDGPNPGDVIGTCGPEGDALIYVAEENKSYCLDYTS